jgi:hypothetical protein
MVHSVGRLGVAITPKRVLAAWRVPPLDEQKIGSQLSRTLEVIPSPRGDRPARRRPRYPRMPEILRDSQVRVACRRQLVSIGQPRPRFHAKRAGKKSREKVLHAGSGTAVLMVASTALAVSTNDSTSPRAKSQSRSTNAPNPFSFTGPPNPVLAHPTGPLHRSFPPKPPSRRNSAPAQYPWNLCQPSVRLHKLPAWRDPWAW